MKNGENTKNNNDNILFKKYFYLICIANICTCMAIYSVMPVLPLYLIDVLHCKESVMGIGLAAFPLVALAVRPFSGMMSDIWLQPGGSLSRWGYSSNSSLPNIGLCLAPNRAGRLFFYPSAAGRRGRRPWESSVFADIPSLHGRQMPDKDMPQRGKIRYAR